MKVLLYNILVVIILSGHACTGNKAITITRAPVMPDDSVWALVPEGTYTVGDSLGRGKADERPAHQVVLASYWIARRETTQKEWTAVMGSGNNPSMFQDPDKPVEHVDFFTTVLFCNQKSVMDGLKPYYTVENGKIAIVAGADGYRLPTEAEWETAARGAMNEASPVYSGADNPDQVAWYRESSRIETWPVALKKPNALGIYDMSGNTAEWCFDTYGPYPADNAAANDSRYRVVRGGAYNSPAEDIRVSARAFQPMDLREGGFIGIRLARNASR